MQKPTQLGTMSRCSSKSLLQGNQKITEKMAWPNSNNLSAPGWSFLWVDYRTGCSLRKPHYESSVDW